MPATPRTILIYEYVTGGGLVGSPIPTSWAVEGAAMRRALAAEFAAARPSPRVLVALDPRLPDDPGPWEVVRIGSIERLEALAGEADCTLLIAPETNGVLEGLIRRLQETVPRLLNGSAEAVALAADKAATIRRLRRRGLAAPRTLLLNPGDPPPLDGPYPAVVKPIDGAGAVETFRIEAPHDLPALSGGDGPRLLQEFVVGVPMSATFLVRPWAEPRLLAIGEQRMEIEGGRFVYRGGVLPSPIEDAGDLARAVMSLPGLEGLVGVDFICRPDHAPPVILEINPRPTTSIVGILGLTPPGRLAEAWTLEGLDAWTAAADALGRAIGGSRPILFDADGSTSRPRVDAADDATRDDAVWMALDVGGANLKAAHASGASRSQPFPVWQAPDALTPALVQLASGFPPFHRLAVTMTAELCDCFETKREGVLRIVESILAAFPDCDVSFWGTDGRFHPPGSIVAAPGIAAASNWLALAEVAARLVGDAPAVLIDVGSTTTDVIPIVGGVVAARGRTDAERLRNGELIYAGTSRTPVSALATELPFQGSSTGIAAEFFATTRDVYVLLGDAPENSEDVATADGRPSTRDRCRDRLARMVCADRDSCTNDDVDDLAHAAHLALLNRLIASARRACRETIGTPTVAVVSGSGEFLARRIAGALVGPSGAIRSLTELWGPAASDAACARALLELAASREAEHGGN